MKSTLFIALMGATTILANPFPGQNSDESVTSTTTQLDTETLFCCDPDSSDPEISRVCKPCGSHSNQYDEIWVQGSFANGMTTLVRAGEKVDVDVDASAATVTVAPMSTKVVKRQGYTAPPTQCVGAPNGKSAFCHAGTSTWIQLLGPAKRTDVPEQSEVVERDQDTTNARCCKPFGVVLICHNCAATEAAKISEVVNVPKRDSHNPSVLVGRQTYNFHLECGGVFVRGTHKCADGKTIIDANVCLPQCSCTNVGAIQCPDYHGCTSSELTKYCTQGNPYWGCACSHLTNTRGLANMVTPALN